MLLLCHIYTCMNIHKKTAVARAQKFLPFFLCSSGSLPWPCRARRSARSIEVDTRRTSSRRRRPDQATRRHQFVVLPLSLDLEPHQLQPIMVSRSMKMRPLQTLWLTTCLTRMAPRPMTVAIMMIHQTEHNTVQPGWTLRMGRPSLRIRIRGWGI